VNEWWRGLAPAQTTVDCAGNSHRLRWEAGALRALDHGDAEGERALAALAGESCTCLELLDAWERHADDIRVLLLASRGPTDVLTTQDDPGAMLGIARPQAGGGAAGVSSRQLHARRGRMISMMGAVRPSGFTYASRGFPPHLGGRMSQKAIAENELVALVGLGGGLPDRLLATVAAAWQERLAQRERVPARSRAQLQAALHGRVFAVMRGWLGTAGPQSRLRMIPETGKRKLISEQDHVRAELPFGWLVDVWAQGLALVWGRFCLSASTEDARTWRLATVGPDFGRPTIVTLRLGA